MPGECATAACHKIGWAIKQVKAGESVTRKGWKVPGQRVSLRGNSRGRQAYLRLTTARGRFWPMTLTHADILAEDWMSPSA